MSIKSKSTRWWTASSIAVVTVAFLGAAKGLSAADAGGVADATTAQPTIAEIMKTAHKKPRQLLKQVATGKATAAEKQELLKLYQALEASKPPKGTAESWAMKTKLLVAAAEAAVKGQQDAEVQLDRAANCKACHQAHK
jgi:hypothetical protein